MKKNTEQMIKSYLPYLLIICISTLTFQYTSLFMTYDFDGLYGKYIGKDAYNFALKDIEGKHKSLHDYKGEFVLLTFGFTKCTGVCPRNLYRFKRLAKRFQKNKQNINFLFISFDNIRDTPKEVNDFLKNFEVPNLQGLVAGKDLGITVARKYMNYFSFNNEEILKDRMSQINHNGFLYLVDPNGKLSVVYMQRDLDERKVIKDIQKLRQQGGNV